MQKRTIARRKYKFKAASPCFLNSAMTHSSKWTLELISCVFPFADLLLVRGMVLLPPAPPVFSAGCHKGQFGTFRGKHADSLRSPFTVKLLDKRIPANSFVIPFFPLSHTLQVNIPFWELRQAENNAIYSRWMMVCVYVLCIYLCVSFVPLLFNKYLLIVYWGMTGDTKLIAVINNSYHLSRAYCMSVLC